MTTSHNKHDFKFILHYEFKKQQQTTITTINSSRRAFISPLP